MSYTEIDSSKEIHIRNHYVNIKISLTEVIEAMRMIKRRTKSENIFTAIELMFCATVPKEDLEVVSTLVMLDRCSRDGNVTPPVDIEKLYKSV